MRSGRVLLFVIVLLAVGGGCPLSGQSGTTSGFYGTVSDVTGAVVPGAKVMLTYVSTQAQRSVTTGPDGTFFFFAVEYRGLHGLG